MPTLAPEWRNWYTHQTQNLAGFTPHVGSSPTSGINNPSPRAFSPRTIKLLNEQRKEDGRGSPQNLCRPLPRLPPLRRPEGWRVVCLGARGGLALAEARAVLGRLDEGVHHLGLVVVAAELFELREPEVVAGEIRVGAAVRVTSEVAEVLHQDEGAVGLLLDERGVLGDLPEHVCAQGGRVRVGREFVHERLPLGARRRDARVREQRVDDAGGAHARREGGLEALAAGACVGARDEVEREGLLVRFA